MGGSPSGRDGLTYTQLDVSDTEQSQAAVVTTPAGEHLFVDTDTDGVVDSLLSSRVAARHGLNAGDTVNYLLLTHYDADHIGGLSQLVETFDVDTVYGPPERLGDNEGNTVSAAEIQRERVHAETSLADSDTTPELAGRAELRFFAPLEHTPSFPVTGRRAADNNSLVFSVAFESGSVLFAGDVYAAAETALLDEYGTDLSATVTTLNHHGSGDANTVRWFGTVRPEVIVAPSVPADYGHPDPAALARATLAGTPDHVGSPYAHGHLTVRVFTDGSYAFVGTDASAVTVETLERERADWTPDTLHTHGLDTGR